MQHLDPGLIHSWLDGALDDAEAAHVEQHVATCEACAAAVAEARGLIAATSRILSSLDDVPSGVLPSGSVLVPHSVRRGFVRRWLGGPLMQMAIAASLLVVALVAYQHRDGQRPPNAPAAPSSSPAPAAPTGSGAPDRRVGDAQPKAMQAPARTMALPDTSKPVRAMAMDAVVPRRDSIAVAGGASAIRADSVRRVALRVAAADSLSRTAAAAKVDSAAIAPVPPAALAMASAAVGAGGGAGRGSGGGGGGGGGGRGGRGGGGAGGGGGAAAGGRGGAPLPSYIGCYALPSNRTDSSSARIPSRFSLRADTAVDGVVHNTLRTLDSTGVENGIVAGLSWRYVGGGVSIVTSSNGIDQPLISIAAGPAGSYVAATPGAPSQAISRIPCTRLNGGG